MFSEGHGFSRAATRATNDATLAGAVPQSEIGNRKSEMVLDFAGKSDGCSEDDLFALVRRAYPYRNLSREDFDSVVAMLSEGISARRGRYGAYLHRDGVYRKLRARRGARLTAITSGGAIPETALYAVVASPEGVVVGTVDEDFAVESLVKSASRLGRCDSLLLLCAQRGRSQCEGQRRRQESSGKPHSASIRNRCRRTEHPSRFAHAGASDTESSPNVGRNFDVYVSTHSQVSPDERQRSVRFRTLPSHRWTDGLFRRFRKYDFLLSNQLFTRLREWHGPCL